MSESYNAEELLSTSIELNAEITSMILDAKINDLRDKYLPCYSRLSRRDKLNHIITKYDLEEKLRNYIGYQLKDLIVNNYQWGIDIYLIIKDWDFRWEIWYRINKMLEYQLPIGIKYDLFICRPIRWDDEHLNFEEFVTKYYQNALLGRIEKFQPFNL